MKKIILSSLCFLTFSAHGAVTEEVLLQECRPVGETAYMASRARQEGIKEETVYSKEKKLHGEKFDWPFREVAIEKAFQIPIKSTAKEKEAATAAFIENILSACLSFKRDQNR